LSSSKPARIITFYSYKGGTGRSMALANIAWILASNAKRVLVVDWDLEAPGLQRYFRPFLLDPELVSSPGIVDLITAFVLEAITPLESDQKLPPDWFMPLTDIDPYIISLNWKFPRGGQIDFIPAGQQGPDYAMRFGAINWQKFYDVLGGGAFIEELKLKMRSGYDYVLVDSRTGVSDTSGICTIQMPDSLVVCFTFNNQSIEGAASITQGVYEQRFTQDSRPLSSSSSGSPEGNGSSRASYPQPYRFRAFPVPMRVDQAEKEKLELRQSYARWKFGPFIERIPAAERRSYWGSVEVPYVPFFAYEEILSPFKEDPSDPKGCLAAFIRIAAEITQQEVQGFQSLTSPQQNSKVLQEFASLPTALPASNQTKNGNDRRGVKAEDRAKSSDTKTPLTSESEIEKAIRRGETTLHSLDGNDREVARLMWMRLVRVPAPGETILNSKVRVKIEDLPQTSTNVTNAFAAADLLTINRDVEVGETTVEVTNEELLRSWPTLNEWIKADRDLMVWRQDLQTNRARWIERDRLPSYLLTGRQLSEAKGWLRTHRQYFSETEAEYIEQSMREDVHRQRRELLRQGLRIAAVLVLIGVIIFAYVFINTRSGRIDQANEIADLAQQKIDAVKPENSEAVNQLQLGILLAVEARRMGQSDKAESILKTTLQMLPKRLSSINPGKAVLDMAITPDSTRLLIVTGRTPNNQNMPEDRSFQVYDISSGSIQGLVPFKQGSRSFQISQDGRYVAVISLESRAYSVTVMEPATGRVVGTIQHQGPVYDMSFSPDGSYFATASGDRKAAFLDLNAPAKGSPPLYLSYPAAVNTVAFSGDNRHLAVADENFQVQVWDITPGQRSWPRPKTIQMDSTAFDVAMTQTGEYLVTLSLNDRFLELWDVQREQRLGTMENRSGPIKTFSFTADDRYVVLAGTGPSLGIWDLNGKKYEPELRAYGDVIQVSSSPDNKYLAVMANMAPAQLWRYDGTFQAAGLLIPQINFTHLEFGAANRVVTADADNVVRVWQVGTEIGTDFSSEACSRLTRNLTAEEWNTYLASYLGAYRRTCSDLP
jgi:WD40 repeat protein